MEAVFELLVSHSWKTLGDGVEADSKMLGLVF